jgi:integrase
VTTATVAVVDSEITGLEGWVGGELRREPRRLPAPEVGVAPVFPPGQEPRREATDWWQTRLSRGEMAAHLAAHDGGTAGSAKARNLGVRQILDWLETKPGDTWQQRWKSSGAEPVGRAWVDAVPRGSGVRGGGTTKTYLIRFGLSSLLSAGVIRPSMEWLLDQHFAQAMVQAFAAIDPDGLAAVRRAYDAGDRVGGQLGVAVNIIGRILVHRGGPLASVTAGDCAAYWWVRRAQGKDMNEGALYYALLFDMGVFGVDAPPSLTAATRRGPRTCGELIDCYDIACGPIRDLLVDYLAARKPPIDYTSLASIAYQLGRLFWKDLEIHHPGIDSLRLSSEVAAGWKERLNTISWGPGIGKRRALPESTMMFVRSFYADIAHWGLEDPVRFGQFVAPCPIRASELSLKKRRKHRKATIDQRTRTLAPVLPVLVRAVTVERDDTSARLARARIAGDGDRFAAAGGTFRRCVPTAASTRIYAVCEETGRRLDLTFEEDRAFWAWAVVEVLRHTGMRIEELLELSHHSFCAYTLPTTGEVVPMLQVAPSKTDTERLLLVSPELGEVLAAMIERVRGDRPGIPLVGLWDGFEKTWSPLMPFLFQHPIGGLNKPITRKFVSNTLNRVMEATGLADPSGVPLRFTPHDFRRIFATDALRSGLPPHIAAKILGHIDLNTTLGYAAIYPEDVIGHHRAFIARRRSLRPSEEYRDLSPAEWDEFLEHFELRKVELGVCTRDFGTPCIHEHACIRCPALRPDPAQQDRLTEILTNLTDRLAEAETQGWRGETAGLEVSIAAAETKLDTMRHLASRHHTAFLGMPDFRPTAGRVTTTPRP